MPAIKLTGFTGEQPRIIPRLMPPTAARSAINCRLDDGGLAPFAAPDIADTVTPGEEETFQSIYLHGEDWLAFEGIVNAVPGPSAGDRLYYTGDDKPKLKVGDDIYDLAVPMPGAALTATPAGGGAANAQIGVYRVVGGLGTIFDFAEDGAELATVANLDVDTVENGCVITAVAAAATSVSGHAWVGADETYDVERESNYRHSGAFKAELAAATPRTINATLTGSGNPVIAGAAASIQ